MMRDYESIASALYDGGWRKEDKDALIVECDMSEEEANAIIELLKEYEDRRVTERD